MRRNHKHSLPRAATTLVAVLSSVTLVVAQTQMTAPANKYKPSDDVQMGRGAAGRGTAAAPA